MPDSFVDIEDRDALSNFSKFVIVESASSSLLSRRSASDLNARSCRKKT
jgi:hypothetical protein